MEEVADLCYGRHHGVSVRRNKVSNIQTLRNMIHEVLCIVHDKHKELQQENKVECQERKEYDTRA